MVPVQMFYTHVPTAVKETFQCARAGEEKKDTIPVSSALFSSMCPCPFLHRLINCPSSDVHVWSSESKEQSRSKTDKIK